MQSDDLHTEQLQHRQDSQKAQHDAKAGGNLRPLLTGQCNNSNNNNNNNGITQAAFPQSGSSSTWETNGFTSLSTDGVAKEHE